jgi:hypothetical protein
MSVPAQIADLWWTRLPLGVSRVSRGLAAALADGIYLSAQPAVGALAPPAALVAGFLIGWLHFSPGETFTYSLPVMGVMLAVGVISAGLGAWLLAGYVIGDFFLRPHAVYDVTETPVLLLLRARLPLLLSYVLLAQLLVTIPLVAATIRRGMPARLRRGRAILGYGLGLVVLGALVYLWTQAVPTLIRPVFTWESQPQPIEAFKPLQELGWVLVFLGVAAMAVRIVVETVARRDVAIREARVQLAIARAAPVGGLVLSPVRAAFRAALTALLLAGIVDNPFEGVVLLGVLFVLFWARDLIQTVLPAWVRLVSRIPVLLRLAAGIALSSAIATQSVNLFWASDTFFPILLSVLLSLGIFAILIPPTGRLARS